MLRFMCVDVCCVAKWKIRQMPRRWRLRSDTWVFQVETTMRGLSAEINTSPQRDDAADKYSRRRRTTACLHKWGTWQPQLLKVSKECRHIFSTRAAESSRKLQVTLYCIYGLLCSSSNVEFINDEENIWLFLLFYAAILEEFVLHWEVVTDKRAAKQQEHN